MESKDKTNKEALQFMYIYHYVYDLCISHKQSVKNFWEPDLKICILWRVHTLFNVFFLMTKQTMINQSKLIIKTITLHDDYHFFNVRRWHFCFSDQKSANQISKFVVIVDIHTYLKLGLLYPFQSSQLHSSSGSNQVI